MSPVLMMAMLLFLLVWFFFVVVVAMQTFMKVFKRHQKENEALLKRYTKERTAMQRDHTGQLEKLITNYERIKINAVRTFERAARRCG